MSNFTSGLFSGGALSALERVLCFSEARRRYLAENVADAETSGCLRKDLSTVEFDDALKRALKRRKEVRADGLRMELESCLQQETVDMRFASRAYEVNLSAMEVSKAIGRSVFRITA